MTAVLETSTFKENEQFIGIRPRTNNYGNFLEDFFCTYMSERWQRQMPITGNNYWTIGAPLETGNSSRFDPTHLLYQAWFGIYTHVGIDGNHFGMHEDEPDIGVLKALAEIDQIVWLEMYRDPKPFANTIKIEERGKIKTDQHNAFLYYGEIGSHSDVCLIPESETRSCFLFPDPKLWQEHVEAYHPINLKGYFAVIPVERAIACVYVNGVEFEDNEKRHHDTWPLLEREAVELIQEIKIERMTCSCG